MNDINIIKLSKLEFTQVNDTTDVINQLSEISNIFWNMDGLQSNLQTLVDNMWSIINTSRAKIMIANNDDFTKEELKRLKDNLQKITSALI